jgi:hypothetical protein
MGKIGNSLNLGVSEIHLEREVNGDLFTDKLISGTIQASRLQEE